MTIWIHDGNRRLRVPEGVDMPEEMEQLRAQRSEILELLQGSSSISRIPLESQIRPSEIPLTAMQRTPWYFCETPHPRYPFGLRISGPLNFEFLQKSLDSLVRRHESLRTRILMTGDKPSQRIDACEEYHLELVDMTGKSSNDVDKSTRSLIKEFIDQKIEPTLGPLFDSRVFKVADDEHILVISIDHLITDAVSIRIFVEELWTMYEQGVNEEPASLTPLSLQYADYALWLEKVYPTWRNVHQSYWEKRLAGAPSISWPTDGNTVEHKVIGLASMKVPIGDRLTAALAGFARRARTLPALVVLAAYVSAVSRWCNQTDLTVSFVDNGRHRPALSRMLGLLASHLHLRFELTRGDKHRDLLELVKMEFYNALYHRDFDWVQSLIPQFQPDLLFNWVPLNTKECTTFGSDRPAHKNRLEWLHLALSREAYSDLKNVLPYKLLLVCCYEGRELTANLHYRNDLFSTEIVDRLARNLRFSLESTVYGLPAIPASNQRDLWD